jgi:hypothetical protein
MKLFTGSLAAGLVLIVSGAQAQVPGPYANGRAPYAAASDFDAPYAAMPPGGGPRYGSGPSLLPSIEVYSVLRDNGFSPLGIPQLRGFVYTIAVIDRGGEDGRLVINARNGRIIRFMPGYRGGNFGNFGNFNEESAVIQGSPGPRPPGDARASGHPPQSTPKVANRTVPIPKANPLAAKPVPAPVQQAAAPQPTEVQAAAPQAATTGSAAAKPAPQVAPTQDMPSMQGLE